MKTTIFMLLQLLETHFQFCLKFVKIIMKNLKIVNIINHKL